MKLSSYYCPSTSVEGTIVMGSSVRPSLDTILPLYSSQGILMKLSSYCCPLTLFKGIIGMGLSFSPSINPSLSVHRHNLVSATSLTVFKGF